MAVLSIVGEGDVPVVQIAGDVDMANATSISSELQALLPNSAAGLVIDLSETTYLDSRGVHLILGLAGRLATRGQRLAVVVSDDSHVRRVLVLTHVDEHVALYSNAEDAVVSVRSSTGPAAAPDETG